MSDVNEQESLQRSWLLITLTTVLRAAGAWILSLVSTPQYQASTQLRFSVQFSDDASISSLTQGGTYSRQAVLS